MKRLFMLLALFWVSIAPAPFPCSGAAADTVPAAFRYGFMKSVFSEVSENDAKAAIKVWGEMVAQEQDLTADLSSEIFRDVRQLSSSLRQKQVDAVTMTTLDYDTLRGELSFSPIFLPKQGGRIDVQYLLLTHRDGPVKDVSDLRGRNLFIQADVRSCIAPLWLDALLARKGHPSAARFASKVSWEPKLSKVVLPVFFRQADACVITRNGFETMCEMNPQIARQLVVLAQSPEIVPVLLAFRADYNSRYKENVLHGVRNIGRKSAGRQVLTIFMSEDLVELPASRLAPTLELIASYNRIAKEKR